MTLVLPSRAEALITSRNWMPATQESSGSVTYEGYTFDVAPVDALDAKEAIQDALTVEGNRPRDEINRLLASWAGCVLLTPQKEFDEPFDGIRQIRVAYLEKMLGGTGTAMLGDGESSWIDDVTGLRPILMGSSDRLRRQQEVYEVEMIARYARLKIKWPGRNRNNHYNI